MAVCPYRSEAPPSHPAWRLEPIRAVTAAIARDRALAAVLDLVIRHAVELVGADTGRIWLWDEREQELRLRAPRRVGDVVRDARGQCGEGVVWTVAQHAEGLIVNDETASLAYPLLVTRTTHCVAIVAEPLLGRGRLLGVIAVYDETFKRAFTERDRGLLTVFADLAATAIEKARVSEDASRRGQEWNAILDVTKRLAGGFGLATMLDSIAEEAARLLGVDNAGIRLREGDELVMAGRAGPARETMVRPRLKLGESLAGLVITNGRPLIVDYDRDAAHAAHLVPEHREADRRLGYGHYLGLPLRVGGHTIGVLAFRARRPFTMRDQALAEAFAAHAAIAIEQSRLFAATEAHETALKRKTAELDSFVYSASHDLKSPLVSIEGLAGTLLAEYGPRLDREGRRLLERIQTNAQHLERLVGDLRTLSRIGREPEPPEDVDLAALVDALLDELAEPIRTRGITVVRGALPTVRAIRTQMEQVMENLLRNAVSYLGDVPAPRVEIQAAEHVETIECIVRDNGIGIDRAYHDKIFEMFQRLNEVEVLGTGAGLPIVKKIVEAAGGRIWIESTRGQGTAVHLTWPRTS